MTGSGWARGSTAFGEITVDVRSVNGRALAIRSRLPASCQTFDREIDRRVRGRLQRGSVTIGLTIGSRSGAVDGMVDQAQFGAVAEVLGELASRHGMAGPTVGDVLRVPGVLRSADGPLADGPDLPADLGALVDAALDSLLEQRRAEGAATATMLRQLCTELDGELQAVRMRAPAVIEQHRQRVLERVNEFLDGRAQQLEADAVIREVALFADRIDIGEELQRLSIHLARIGEVLDGGGEVGRTLEFLAQETLREANTIGSKSPDVDIAHHVVAMKTRIDKLKEQAANLE